MLKTLAIGALLGASIALPIGPALINAQAAQLPVCAEEDGNTNGQPCTWTDPQTGRAYFVDSANYR